MLRVLTPNGFQPFDGIKIEKSRSIFQLGLSDNSILKCTANHRLKCADGTFAEVSKLKIGDRLHSLPECLTINSINRLKADDVYDLLNVRNGNAYWTNNLVSHNCVLIDECLAGKETIDVRRKSDGKVMRLTMKEFWNIVQ